MSFWGKVWDSITGAFAQGDNPGSIGKMATWMENNKVATNLFGSTLMGIGGYFAQKEANKDLMRQQKELLNLQDQMKTKYSEVPDVDFGYSSLVVDESPNLANGGILTELTKRHRDGRRA